jgi:hypothetical protein
MRTARVHTFPCATSLKSLGAGLALPGEEMEFSEPRPHTHPDLLPFPDRILMAKYRGHYFSRWMRPMASGRTSVGCPNALISSVTPDPLLPVMNLLDSFKPLDCSRQLAADVILPLLQYHLDEDFVFFQIYLGADLG